MLFAYLARACTLEFVTDVLVLPQRQTALVAKQVATLAALAPGRVRLGVGIGWNAVEYDALGVDFRKRATRIEEQIELLRRLWTEPSVDHAGASDTVEAAGIAPLPPQPIPIWLGTATAPPALAASVDWPTVGSRCPMSSPARDSTRPGRSSAPRRPRRDAIPSRSGSRAASGCGRARRNECAIGWRAGATAVPVRSR